MFPSQIFSVYTNLLFSARAVAQFPTRSIDLTTIKSVVLEGARIQYKEVDICETTHGVKSFSGYIHLPANSLQRVGLGQPRPINTFFWFFESRKDTETAPLTLYLNGGPGNPSIIPALRENGPCKVNVDSTTTRPNPWSWNTESNIVFIDQPVNTGFSYDVPANGTVDIRGDQALWDFKSAPISQDSRLLQAGIMGLGSLDGENAVNTTEAAVRSLWLSLSIWLQDFPESRSHGNQLGLWTASYGGHWASALYDFTMAQNSDLERNLSVLPRAPKIRFSSIGLANACVDALVQLPAYLEIAYNNTYGLQMINESTYISGNRAWDGPEGCKAQIEACRQAAGTSPYLGDNEPTNTLCHNANTFCGKHIASLASTSGRSFFDIGYRSNFLTDPTLHSYLGYLRLEHVQAALGVPVNFTDQAISLARAFPKTGDNVRGNYLASLARALDDGVRVSLMYGDRDYACNWLGGEALSLKIQHSNAHLFRNAGYESVHLAGSNEKSHQSPKAYVRQHGNLSFIRVLNSGHTINTEQPPVGFTIFNRTVSGVDIASGRIKLISGSSLEPWIYTTMGPSSTWDIKNHLPADAYAEEGMCYTLALSVCSSRQVSAYLQGHAKVKDYWVVDYGDGTCSPNPVDPCSAVVEIGKAEGESPGIWVHWVTRHEGNDWKYIAWIMLVVLAVVAVVWFYFPAGARYMRVPVL